MADEELMDILEESDAESELTESEGEEEAGEASEEEEGDQKPLQGEWTSQVQDPLNVQSPVQDPVFDQLDRGGSGGSSNPMLIKQETFDQTDAGWFDQHHSKDERVKVKQEHMARRRARGN